MWIFVRVLGQKDVSVHSKVVESDEFYVISCLVFQTFKIRPKSSWNLTTELFSMDST